MTQKEKAIELLRKLDICDHFINWFEEEGYVVLFDLFIGEPLFNHPEVVEKIKEVEKEYGCLVYAVTHEHFVFGECYSFLAVSKYEEDWSQSFRRIDTDSYLLFSYVWNKTDETCSEFGSIVVKSGFGGIMRIE